MPALEIARHSSPSSAPEMESKKKTKHAASSGEKKHKKKKNRQGEEEEDHTINGIEPATSKKKNRQGEEEEDHTINGIEPATSKKKKNRQGEEEEDHTINGIEPATSKRKLPKAAAEEDSSPKRSKKKKKTWGSDVEEEEEEKEKKEDNPNAVSNFSISEVLRQKLKSKGIESLFPIQAMTFEIIFNGSDMVGRARTGQGKTLAFVLPILESLTSGPNAKGRNTAFGRAPSVIVLVPTRELAKQVHADFEVYGGAVGLNSSTVYGGAPYGPQEYALRRGVDIIVGTPGRIKDLIEKGSLNLKSLKFRVLDEADEMLNMGFVEHVENILGKVEDASKVQTLLFSATMPDWVKKIASRFLKPDRKTADLVGDDKMKASRSVRHIVLPCFYSARAQVIPDVIRCYSSGGSVIIFTETKNAASELAGSLPNSRALHGDIQQSQREVILAGFRSGKFSVLVATDVAARGLDINDVQLIIQCEPPRDVETYIHRSGRTGRAGNTGVSVMLYDRKKQYMISQIERQAGVKFERVSAPQPGEVAQATGSTAAESIMSVSDSVLPIFRKSAEDLVKNGDLSPVDIIAKALAKIAGYTEFKRRSLLSSQEGFGTLILKTGRTMHTPSYAFSILRRVIPEENIDGIKGMSLTADGTGAVFDVPNEQVDLFLAGQENADGVDIEVIESLPEMQEVRNDQSRGAGGGGRGGRGGYSNGRGGSWSGSRGGGGSRGSGRSRGGGRGRGRW